MIFLKVVYENIIYNKKINMHKYFKNILQRNEKNINGNLKLNLKFRGVKWDVWGVLLGIGFVVFTLNSQFSSHISHFDTNNYLIRSKNDKYVYKSNNFIYISINNNEINGKKGASGKCNLLNLLLLWW